jgi:hypothetical protein
MTEGEIRRVYKAARNKKKQIPILAQLNCCSTGRILEIVHSKADILEEEADQRTVECDSVSPEQKALIDRLDELNAMIKPLEDEYRRTAKALMKIKPQY